MNKHHYRQPDADSSEPEDIASRSARLATYSGPDRVISRAELEAEIASAPPVKKFNTGISGLDALVDGIEAGELIAIGGPRKNGKTLLAQTLTSHLVDQGAECLWLSYEVPPRLFVRQVPGSVRFFAPRSLRAADLFWLEDRIIEAGLKHETRCVFIDNLHFLVDLTHRGNISLDIGTIVRALKRMAIEHNLVIFILCHSRKPDIDKKTGIIAEVTDWDLRDSSFVPQESDTTWMVQRSADGKTMVKVCCHRRTGKMAEKIWMHKPGLLLEEWFDESNSVESPGISGYSPSGSNDGLANDADGTLPIDD